MRHADRNQVANALRAAAVTLAYLAPELQVLRKNLRLPLHEKGKQAAQLMPELFGYWREKFGGRQATNLSPVTYAFFWGWLTGDDGHSSAQRAQARRDLSQPEESHPYPSTLYFEEVLPHAQIVKNQWLAHFTNHGEAVAKRGFRRGIADVDKLGLTVHLPDEAKAAGGFNFALDASDGRFIRKAAHEWQEGFRFGNELIVFRANGYRLWHRTDEQQEVVFMGRTANSITQVTLRDEGWAVMGRDGPVFQRGREESDLWKCVEWVKKNYQQYHRVLDQGAG